MSFSIFVNKIINDKRMTTSSHPLSHHHWFWQFVGPFPQPGVLELTLYSFGDKEHCNVVKLEIN